MDMHLHWITATALSLSEQDLDQLFHILKVPRRCFSISTTASGSTIYKYKVPQSGSDETVFLRCPTSPTAYALIHLKGAFFEWHPNFPLHRLMQFIKEKCGNFRRVDYAFDDNENCLKADELFNMSRATVYRNFIKGLSVQNRKRQRKYGDVPDANNRKGVPDLHGNHRWCQYGDASGNYVKLYDMRGFVRVELTVQNSDHNEKVLSTYDPDDLTAFVETAKACLVKYLNFCTPESIRSKRPEPIPAWEGFLQSRPVKLRWKDKKPEGEVLPPFDEGLLSIISQINRFCGKHFEFEVDYQRVTADCLLELLRLYERHQAFLAEVADF